MTRKQRCSWYIQTCTIERLRKCLDLYKNDSACMANAARLSYFKFAMLRSSERTNKVLDSDKPPAAVRYRHHSCIGTDSHIPRAGPNRRRRRDRGSRRRASTKFSAVSFSGAKHNITCEAESQALSFRTPASFLGLLPALARLRPQHYPTAGSCSLPSIVLH